MLKGFKQFIMRGNLVELAVAFIMGTAFTAVVTATVKLIMSLIAKVSGGKQPNFDKYQPGDLPVGAWVTAMVSFLILATVVYFFVVVPYNRLQRLWVQGKEDTAAPSKEVSLLTEIRDLLEKQSARPARPEPPQP